MDLIVRPLTTLPLELSDVEIVERKGLGHPDTICDALAEELSIALCRFYQERFGLLLHHNVDKVLLSGGMARPAFGGGKVLAPSEIFLAGRATQEFKGVKIPVQELAIESSRNWLRNNFHVLDPEKHIKIHCLVKPGSVELTELYARGTETNIWLANDTSCGVGFAPMSHLEQVVYQVEKYLNSPKVKESSPEIGEDIKVMGIRRGAQICLTLACAFVDRFVRDLDDYSAKKAHLQKIAQEAAQQVINKSITIELNTGDDLKRGNCYLTVIGTSAEAGDDGQVGRGNRVNGLICPYRPMTLEAAAGKNPVTHVGKLYNVVANLMAQTIIEEIEPVKTAYCYLVSQIGQPVTQPQIIDVQLQMSENQTINKFQRRIEEIVQNHLLQINRLWQRLVERDFTLY
ncbi:MAG: methionine adenosyltransferase [Xenococcaceae cyanobacterium MO_188.B19]|nr:methionine adenosyltransferase [Xenococcaceae cyanobacterium MO_188.B19]